MEASKKLVEILEAKGEKVAFTDLTREDMAEAVEDAFRYDRLVVAASSYDGGVFPCMESFIAHLKSKAYQKRTVAFVENGSWAPTAKRVMAGMLEKSKNLTLCEETVTIKSSVTEETEAMIDRLADELMK